MRVAELKYRAYRDQLQDGDIILASSRKPTATAIKLIDNSEYHHSEIVVKKYERVFGLGAHPEGGGVDFLSRRIKKKRWDDIMILRPLKDKTIIHSALNETLSVIEKFPSYDFFQIFQILIYQKFGIWPKDTGNMKFICSELTQYYFVRLGFNRYAMHNLKRPFFTPGDHIRLLNDLEVKIICK